LPRTLEVAQVFTLRSVAQGNLWSHFLLPRR